MNRLLILILLSTLCVPASALAQRTPTKSKLARWLKRFPDADANGDGILTVDEARKYRSQRSRRGNGGAKRNFTVDPGWFKESFPADAVCYKTPEEIKEIFGSVTSYEKPADGALRIIGTGHSFMAPGYRTLPIISKSAGFENQPLLTHLGGGMTGSARYKWEQENGIFEFKGRPEPKLLASLANAKWDVMMWGPYFQDKPEYYQCWMDFALQYNSEMKFYLSDGWPQLENLKKRPKSESELTAKDFVELGKQKNKFYGSLVDDLNKKHSGKAFVIPTNDAMVLATQYFFEGRLPGVQGINTALGGKKLSLWRDQLGHLGPGFDCLEGYVFYATVYGKSPELIDRNIVFPDRRGRQSKFPSQELDKLFRKIAWQAVIKNPRSGVKDENGDGIAD